jgi:hypothetical protein
VVKDFACQSIQRRSLKSTDDRSKEVPNAVKVHTALLLEERGCRNDHPKFLG